MLDDQATREATGAAAPPGNEPAKAPLATDRAPVEDRVMVASQRQLIWWRFRKHKLALCGAVVVVLFYLLALGGDFFAYADPNQPQGDYVLVPPRGIALRVHPLESSRDPLTLQPIYAPDMSRTIPVRLFAHGYRYKLFGLIPTNIHLIGTSRGSAGASLFILGTDEQGRDVFSRLVLATRTSLFIGLVGVALSVLIGVVLGGLSGYYGGLVDTVVQRLIEIVSSLPTIPLWMGLAAAVPRGWSVERTYFVITLIVSLIGWAGLARVVRGRFLQVRHEDFVLAAELVGARPRRLIFVHMLPLFTSHIIAAVTLAIPLMIIAETSLSFLGLGLHPPAVSWGVMLQQAQNVQSVANSPWMLLPVIPVVIAILSFNFVGDGLRDAADPYD
jgi:peptide/nickel transport system permease protein